MIARDPKCIVAARISRFGCMISWRTAWVGSFISVLVGCTSTQIPVISLENDVELTHQKISIAMDMEREYLTKLHELAWPIFKANTELCGSLVGPALGTIHRKPNSFFKSSGWEIKHGDARLSKSELSETLPKDKSTRGHISILAVVPNSPADDAGLQVGDTILKVEGPETTHTLIPSMGIVNEWPQAREDVSALVLVERRGRQHRLEITPEQICHVSLNVELTGFIYWTGIHKFEITFTSVAIKLLTTHHSHLQFVIARQLAQIVLHAAPEQATWTSQSEDSDTMDLNADYVALYMLARAGVDLEAVRNYYLRRAIETPRSNVFATFSPEMLKKHLNLMSAWKEIQQKIEKGLPLLPDQERNSS